MKPQVQVIRSGDPVAHQMVARIAREAACELYEILMEDNQIRAEWKRQNPGADEAALLRRFVARNWGTCIPLARATLARMLSGPLPDHLKVQIHDALIKDRSLRPAEPSKAPGTVILNREALQ